jgi:hypothetical protein
MRICVASMGNVIFAKIGPPFRVVARYAPNHIAPLPSIAQPMLF